MLQPDPETSPDAAGHYWASRKWCYDWKYAPGGLRKKPEAELPINQIRRRNDAANQAGVASIPPDPIVCQVLQRVKIDPTGTLNHAGFTAAVRPIALRLLVAMCKSAGRSLPMAELCHALWGRSSPASTSALHTTVFRANDALLRAHCPLRIGIQDQWATIRYAKLGKPGTESRRFQNAS